MGQPIGVILALGLVVALVFLLPFFSKRVEEELESFVLLMGVAAVTLSDLWSRAFVVHNLSEASPIALTVLIAGVLFYFLQERLEFWIESVVTVVGRRGSLFLMVTGLGLLSAVLTAVITPLLLAEALSVMRLPRELKVRIAVLGCLAIGLGSILTPLGGPLTAIVANRLRGEPYHADFFFILRLMGPWVFPTLYGLGLYAAMVPLPAGPLTFRPERYKAETLRVVFARAIKVYLFVVGLLFLAAGLSPMVDQLITRFSTPVLYWFNMSSAILDNASIAAAEIGPAMSLKTIQYLLIGLSLSGVMLVPGNLPNMVAAAKLGIKSGEWAKVGVPLGLFLMTFYFFALRWLLQ